MDLQELLGPAGDVAAGVGFRVLVTVLLWTVGRGTILLLVKLLGGNGSRARGVSRVVSLVLSTILFVGIVAFVGPEIATFAALVLAMGLESAWRGPAMGRRKAARR